MTSDYNMIAFSASPKERTFVEWINYIDYLKKDKIVKAFKDQYNCRHISGKTIFINSEVRFVRR